ncbi:DNA polymerase/3'-5' exonuclease PolX [Planctomicrobium piriforme]|uniref:DNA polymerase beta n=1 Tax=Planctomicrobium piriforme TaxID=1576369 RepID=A0A1I3GZ00_9PLAN|nr:DNA polymerase/3'-5' exonuclease PolX [Planctomicrobium piriforme]SFI28532.1 DNA polymerase (family 10) [Planctomicrobium piriforme]
MHNLEIANRLEETASLLELQEANAFRVRAYRNAARTIGDLSEAVAEMVGENPEDLKNLSGVGKDIAAKIVQLVREGSFPLLAELRAQFPAGLLQIMHLPGLGPKKAALLHKELGIQNAEELKAAAVAGKVAELKGFGKKTEQTILASLEQFDRFGQRVLISEARAAAERILHDLELLPGVAQAAIAGSCRRRLETCGDLDLLVTSADAEGAMAALAQHDLVESVLAKGPTKQRVRLRDGLELDLRVVPEESFGAALQYFTGSKEHNIVIRRRATERGLKLNEYGLFDGETAVAGRTEAEIYEAVGLPWIPPELRENRGEIELAEQNALPDLLKLEDIQADLHMHTTASDGTASIREMIEAARERGRKYIAITDHSKRVSMANGLDATRLRKHWAEIRKIREEYSDIDVLLGVECDILENADLDLEDDVLAEADWVLAVLHYGLKQPREQIMLRLLNAIRNPHVCAIGHPSGRMVGRRAGADIHYPDLFKAAADHGVMLEINANPHRLDLDDLQAHAAREHGIPIVINTDAHSTAGMDVMEYGVDQARRAGLTKKDVANTRSLKQFQRLLRTRS